MPPVIGKGSAVSQEKIVDLNIDTAIIWYYQVALAKVLQTKGLRGGNGKKHPAFRLSRSDQANRQVDWQGFKGGETGN